MSHLRFLNRSLLCFSTVAAVAVGWLFAPSSLIKAEAAVSDAFTLTIVPQDIWPPAAVTDLVASAGGEGQLLLEWTAPDEEGGLVTPPGRVAGYTVRIATFSADSVSSTTTWWNAATDVAGEPAPLDPGDLQSLLRNNLTPGVTYYAAIISTDDASLVSPIDTNAQLGGTPQAFAFLTDLAPPAPASVTALSGSSQVAVSWDSSTVVGLFDFIFFRVYRSTESGAGPFAQITTTAASGYTDTGLTNGLAHYYKVVSVDSGAPEDFGTKLESSFSVVVATPGAGGPLAPVIVSTATFAISTAAIQWGWAQPAPPAVDGFRVISTTGGVLAEGLSPTTTFFAYSGFSANEQHGVRIEAFNVNGTALSAAATRFTLANPPTGTFISSTTASPQIMVTLDWTDSGATLYEIRRSTFDLLTDPAWATGTLVGSVLGPTSLFTDNNSLQPLTTYFYAIRGFNGDDIPTSFDIPPAVSTVTPVSPAPAPPTLIRVTPNALNRTITLEWTNPAGPGFEAVAIFRSSTAQPSQAQSGTVYTVGGAGEGDSRTIFNSSGTLVVDSGLQLNATYFFSLFSRNGVPNYSAAVTTSAVLDLVPAEVVGLKGTVGSGSLEISWSGVVKNLDQTSFVDPQNPKPEELIEYEVFSSTSLMRPVWNPVFGSPTPVSSITHTTTQFLYYKVQSVDAFGKTQEFMILDRDLNLYALAPDQVSHLKVPAAVTSYLYKGSNKFGEDIFIRAVPRTAEIGTTQKGKKVFQAMEFEVRQNGSMGPMVGGFAFAEPSAEVHLHYEVQSGVVVPASAQGGSAQGTSAQEAQGQAIEASEAAGNLSVYWFNGTDYVQLYGDVDAVDQVVTVKVQSPGSYQIRGVARGQGFNFDLSGLTTKVITPNGDGLNDVVVFLLDNPKDSKVGGKLFDLTGAFVAEMRLRSDGYLEWDGKSGGQTVHSGVYIYQIEAEGKTFNGTLVVAR
ncbi:MAG: gliding motility-associated C-terminal domain-containing protein [Elusimicrobia bacterium]|nr:gliding motility-associated C-terminal domain-containing protein [Elusimicrobiota bacterium]